MGKYKSIIHNHLIRCGNMVYLVISVYADGLENFILQAINSTTDGSVRTTSNDKITTLWNWNWCR